MNQKKSMNMLFLFSDQQRTDTLGCYGNALVDTPHADSLAESGVKFDCAYTPNAVCTPARASLLTGLMPHKHCILTNFERNIGYPEVVNEAHIPFSHYLKEAGYNVGLEGKWHVSEKQPASYFGFDAVHFPGWGNPIDHPEYLEYLTANKLPPFSISNETRGVLPNGKPTVVFSAEFDGPLEATFEYFLAHRTINKLKQYAEDYRETGQPFYLACHWFGPHLPYIMPSYYYNLYDSNEIELSPAYQEEFHNKPMVQRHYSKYWAYDCFTETEWKKYVAVYRGYAKMIDDLTGMIVETLNQLNLQDSTAVFFTTDHGEFTGSHKMNDKGPAMYEDIYRIPLIIRMPEGLQGSVSEELVSLVDVTATFIELSGTNVPERYDGRSLVPILKGCPVPNWRKEIICEFHGLHFPYPQRMLKDSRFKLVINPADVSELYDLENDPYELVNQIDNTEYSQIKKEMVTKLFHSLKDTQDNFYSWLGANFEMIE
ncbi:sulfatase-like hydrolase/transferase [Paenibacillus sp. LjRoot56]|uniref:sulfatase-like hydrolase/transferase n=1 Tax=Paenibacillus sp. LjRoot56 TaxID=3342333 RepID=UPI003ED05D75